MRSCSSTCEASFEHRQPVVVSAVAGPRARFTRWADSDTSSRVRRFRVATTNPSVRSCDIAPFGAPWETPAWLRVPFGVVIARRHRRLMMIAAPVLAAASAGAGHGLPDAGGQSPAAPRLSVEVRDISETPNRASTAGRVISSPAGIDCPRSCARDVPRGRAVVLRVTTNPGFTFDQWVIYAGDSRVAAPPPDSCSSARTCSLRIDDDTRIVAEIRPAAQILITTEGAGRVAVAPAGNRRHAEVCSNDGLSNDNRHVPPGLPESAGSCFPAVVTGARVKLRAIADTTVAGARFDRWSDYRCGRRPTCTVTVRGRFSITAMFDPVFLGVAEGTFGPVTVRPARPRCRFEADPALRVRTCRVALPRHTRITLTRRSTGRVPGAWQFPETNSKFPCEPPDLPADVRACAFTLDTSHLVVAGTIAGSTGGNVGEYIRLEYTGPRGGRIVIRPLRGHGPTRSCRRTCEASFEHRTRVQIRVLPGRRTRFVRWADDPTRSRVRNIRVGTTNPVRAIFARR